MSVLIKTMTKLPEYCYDCPCHDGESGYCQADKERRYSEYRPFWCPLVEIESSLEVDQNEEYEFVNLGNGMWEKRYKVESEEEE